ncbi:hypothetical protein D3C87_1272430 [compost metagenome]
MISSTYGRCKSSCSVPNLSKYDLFVSFSFSDKTSDIKEASNKDFNSGIEPTHISSFSSSERQIGSGVPQ